MGMTMKEFTQKSSNLAKQYNKKKLELYKSFALLNNPYQVGMIIEDHLCIGRILKIKVYVDESLSNEPSQCKYVCTRLRKSDLKPTKSGEIVNIYQSNIRRSYGKKNDEA